MRRRPGTVAPLPARLAWAPTQHGPDPAGNPGREYDHDLHHVEDDGALGVQSPIDRLWPARMGLMQTPFIETEISIETPSRINAEGQGDRRRIQRSIGRLQPEPAKAAVLCDYDPALGAVVEYLLASGNTSR